MGNYVVTFARGFGSGGKEIASKLAKELGIHCYEKPDPYAGQPAQRTQRTAV